MSATLPASLETFFESGWISEVLHEVKSGKEATVFCCRAGPRVRGDLVAAKLYRERRSRGFKNDAVYREGRIILDQRLRRAVAKKSAAGQAFLSGSWVWREWETLRLLYAAGASVPRPLAQADEAILMEYVGDAHAPAPPLNTVSLEPEEARRLFERVLENVELWLARDRVHADLSAFNILYWQGAVTIIDFPQAIDPRFNPNAYALLLRDLENVCRYFGRQGVAADPARLADDLWRRFQRAEL